MRLLVLEGDGIGPEICAATMKVVRYIDAKLSLGCDFVYDKVGRKSLESYGTTWSSATEELARTCDGIILGPVDTFSYPEGQPNPSARIRKNFDLYANIRPAKTRPTFKKNTWPIDCVVFRENTEGFYADRSMFAGSGEFCPTEDVAISMRKITTKACLRIAKSAFSYAARHNKAVTAVHKANVLKLTDGMFLDCIRQTALHYPSVQWEEIIVDAMAAHLVRTPERFDVIVTTNMYGDILSDLTAEMSGGLGLGASINAGDDFAMAQAVHGSAPDIAGQNIANPTSLILSVALLFTWWAQEKQNQDFARAAHILETCVDHTLQKPESATPDVGGNGSTQAFADEVCSAIEAGI